MNNCKITNCYLIWAVSDLSKKNINQFLFLGAFTFYNMFEPVRKSYWNTGKVLDEAICFKLSYRACF